jgi:hypothetical protein
MYMPYAVIKKDNGHYKLINELTGSVHAKDTSKTKAMAQLHLLQGIKHGMKPRHNYQSKIVPKIGRRNTLEK